MDHKVRSVTELHVSATNLYTVEVMGGSDSSADTILNNLKSGIENLKVNWKGADAVVRIGEVMKVYNNMVAIRNALAELAVESSKVAAGYREIQNNNGAGLENLSVLSFETKTTINNDLVVTDEVYCYVAAEEGRVAINKASNSMPMFKNAIEARYNEIMENWTQGRNRDVAVEAFTTFQGSVNSYIEILQNVSMNIATALQNYNG